MHTPITPIQEFAVEDWPTAQEAVNARISSDAYALTELTDFLDANLHHVVLDPATRTVWWAYDNSPATGEDGWIVCQLSAEDAAQTFSNQIDMVQDRMDEPSQYADSAFDLDEDQAVLDEYARILQLQLPAEPRDAAARIKHQRRLIARQDALWQRVYTELVRDLAGTERGGRTRAAEALGITSMQVGRIIREDDQRRATLAAAAKEVR